MRIKKGNQKMLMVAMVVVFVSIGAATAIAASGIVPNFKLPSFSSVTPGFEGLQFYIYGFSQGNLQTATPTGTQLQAPFSWASSGANQAVIQAHDTTKQGQGWLTPDYMNYADGKLNVQMSYTSTDTSNPVQQIDYYVLKSTSGNVSTYEHVVGYVVPAYFTVNVFSMPGSGEYTFSGQQVWLVGQTNVWNHAMIDPSNPQSTFVSAYSVPVAAAVDSYTLNGYNDDQSSLHTVCPQWVINKAQLSPQNNGQPLTFYTSPTTSGANPGSLYLNPSQLTADAYNTTFAGDPSPDTRFVQQVYTPITLANFGGSDNGWPWLSGQAQIGYPSVTYHVKVYYLMLGTFIFQVNNAVNSTLPGFQSQNSTVTSTVLGDLWQSFTSWATSPLVQIGFILTMLVIGVIVVTAFLILTPIGRAAGAAFGKRRN